MNYSKAKFYKSCYVNEQLFCSKKNEIVFVGRSNVGKSSIINKILNRKKLARVSNVPGKTISINFYEVDEIYFVDFPGYGFAKISKNKKRNWDNLANEYFSSKRKIILAVLVLDVRRGIEKLDYDMIKYLIDKKIYFILILNKIDKLKKNEISKVLEKTSKDISFLKNIQILLFSSKTGYGIETFKETVEKFNDNNKLGGWKMFVNEKGIFSF